MCAQRVDHRCFVRGISGVAEGGASASGCPLNMDVPAGLRVLESGPDRHNHSDSGESVTGTQEHCSRQVLVEERGNGGVLHTPYGAIKSTKNVQQ